VGRRALAGPVPGPPPVLPDRRRAAAVRHRVRPRRRLQPPAAGRAPARRARGRVLAAARRPVRGDAAGHARTRLLADRGGRAERRAAAPARLPRQRRPPDLEPGAAGDPLLPARARRPGRRLGRRHPARPPARPLHPPPPGDPPMTNPRLTDSPVTNLPPPTAPTP